MKKRILSLVLTLTMLASMCAIAPLSVSAETYSPVETVDCNSTIKIGDYIQIGTYYDSPILWRCVAFEKIIGYTNENIPIIDSTDTVTEYKDGYLPLMLSDKILCVKPYDAAGSNTSGSHGRNVDNGKWRKESGSNYWGDSNIRCWLNSKESSTNIVWLCGNTPSKVWCGNSYDQENGFLNTFEENEISSMVAVSQKFLTNAYEYSDLKDENRYMPRYDYMGGDPPSDEFVLTNYNIATSEQFIDKVFLPDIKQINEVYNNSNILGEGYHIGVLSNGAVDNNKGYNFTINYDDKWYTCLRTPVTNAEGKDAVATINTLGNVFFTTPNYGSVSGIRPAFFLNTNTCFESGNGTVTFPYKLGETPISVYLNDKKIDFDVPPVIENGRTLVPLRAIFEAMGMTVDWDGATSTITAIGNGNSILMRVNETTATVNGKTLTMDVPSKVVDGRTLVPVRFIAESIGAEVDWDGENRIVNIRTKVLSDDKTRLFPVTYTSALPNLGDITIDFYYSDSYFVNGDGYSYNHDLARASLAYEISSWDVNELETMYNDKLKVENYQLYNYDKSLDDGSDKAAYSIAHKKLYDGTTLISVAVRGANYGAEWKSDFHVGTTCYHKGFYDPAYEIYENLKTYAKVHNIDLNSTRMWITGYSRGAAIGNLVSGFIDRDILNNGKKYFDNGNRLYSYLFAVPSGVDIQYIDTSNEVFDNIYNIVLPYDVVPKVVMEDWGWGRFGKTLMVKNRNSNPQNANEKYFKNLTNNLYEYSIGKEQTQSGNKAADALADSIGSPQEYNQTYEKTIMDLAEWIFWVSQKNGDLSVSGLANYIYEKYENGDYSKTDYDESHKYAYMQTQTHYEYIKKLFSINADINAKTEEFEGYVYYVLQMFYLNGYRGDSMDLIVNISDGFKLFGLMGVAFDKNISTVANAHNSEYYISWMFAYDDPKDIFQDFK